MEDDFVHAAIAYLLRPRRWYQWAQVQDMDMREFRDRVAPDIKLFMYGAGYQFDDHQAAVIAEELWKKLRSEAGMKA